MSLRGHRERADQGLATARTTLTALEKSQPKDPLARMAYWREIYDAAHSAMYDAANDAREDGISWSGIAVAYDRSEPTTHTKFGSGRPKKGHRT